MDLETMRIALNDETEGVMKKTFLNEYGGQCGQVAYTRKVTREPNEEGKWQRLLAEIEEMSHIYGVDFDKAIEIFESVSCCKKQLKSALENQEYVSWSNCDDLALNNVDSLEYKQLVKTKGLE